MGEVRRELPAAQPRSLDEIASPMIVVGLDEVDELEAELQNLMTEQRARFKDLRRRLAEHETALSDLRRQLRDQRARASDLQRQLARAEADLSNLHRQRVEQEARIEDLRRQCREYQRERDNA